MKVIESGEEQRGRSQTTMPKNKSSFVDLDSAVKKSASILRKGDLSYFTKSPTPLRQENLQCLRALKEYSPTRDHLRKILEARKSSHQ